MHSLIQTEAKSMLEDRAGVNPHRYFNVYLHQLTHGVDKLLFSLL